MRNRILGLALALTLAAASVLAAEPAVVKPETKPETATEPKLKLASEPVKCYRLVGLVDAEMPVGLAVELCAATPSALKTFECFAEAFMPTDNDGLGLTRGLAVDLCRTIPRE